MTKHATYYEGGRPEVLPFLPQRYAKVLEIGCGDGGFRKLVSGDCEYWGVELEESAGVQAQQFLDKVLIGTFEDVCPQLPDNYFDLVICNDVIEHFADHDRFLQQIREKMVPQGCIVGSIPNVRYYKVLASLIFMKDWRYSAKGILDSTHLRFFTKKSVARTFARHGFQTELLKGINSAVYLKKKYCTSIPKTVFNSVKFVLRYLGFLVLDVATLGHSTDVKYAQVGFRFRLKS